MLRSGISFLTIGKTLSAMLCLMLASLLLASLNLLTPFTDVSKAYADDRTARPNVLIVDAGLGDGSLAELHWLGDHAQVVGEQNGWVLNTAEQPSWWTTSETSGAAPATFFLRSSNNASLTVDSIVWALDQIRTTTGNAHTFAIGIGPSGLQLRVYAEDLATIPQSTRADIAGLAFIGVPQNGYSAIALYPEQPLWEELATSANLSVNDLSSGSEWIEALNKTSLPSMLKVLSISGAVGDLGFGSTDGAGITEDFTLEESVSDQVEALNVNATVARQLDLTGFWNPFTSNINYPNRAVDGKLTERLSGMASYETSSDIPAIVQDFYETWYGKGSPVTHNSSVILIDTSGSMMESIGKGETKLQAAEEATDQYLLTMQSFESLPQSPPTDVAVYGFNETVTPITDNYTDESINAINAITAHGETNIGLALEQAISTLQNAPVGAYKHVLILSDGESTRGMSDREIIDGPIAKASEMGVVIDTVGFGDIGESDASFLKELASATGGNYYQADNAYNLKVDFLKSYYESLGVNHFEEEISASTPLQTIGFIDNPALALQIGIVGQNDAPNVELLRDGEVVDSSLYNFEQYAGLTSFQVVDPAMGEYAVRIINADQNSHLFFVVQQGIGEGVDVVGEATDYSSALLIIAGLAAAFLIILVIVKTLKPSKSRSASTLQATTSKPKSQEERH